MFLWLWRKTSVNHTLLALPQGPYCIFLSLLSSKWLVLCSSALSNRLWQYILPPHNGWNMWTSNRPSTSLKQRLQCEHSWYGYWRKLRLLIRHVVISSEQCVCVPSAGRSVEACVLILTIHTLLEACSSSGPFYCNVNPWMETWERDRVRRTHVVNISLFFL